MNPFIQELSDGLPDLLHFERAMFRIFIAVALGAVVGYQRQRIGKPAGLRTHMLVSLGAALIVISCLEFNMSSSDVSRVIQGLITGIGFLGAGAIMKLSKEHEIRGLTSAAGIWMTAAIGITAGLGRWGTATLAALLTYFVLVVVEKWEYRYDFQRTLDPKE